MSIEIVTDELYENVEISDISDNGYFRIKQKPDVIVLHKDDLPGFIAALTRLGQEEKA